MAKWRLGEHRPFVPRETEVDIDSGLAWAWRVHRDRDGFARRVGVVVLPEAEQLYRAGDDLGTVARDAIESEGRTAIEPLLDHDALPDWLNVSPMGIVAIPPTPRA
jgi:hypothetical protein